MPGYICLALRRGMQMFGNLMLKLAKPKWAKRLEVAMARIEEKLQELSDALAPIKPALDGISGDLQGQATKLDEAAAEIAALKEALTAAQSNSGELSQELVDRFDALTNTLKEAAAQATEINDRIPDVPEVPTEG